MKRMASLFLALLLMLSVLPAAMADGSGETAAHLLIDQVYGGGGKGSTPISNSFIQLYNPDTQAIDLSGCTLACGGQSLELTGTIPAQGSYLVVGAAESTSDDYLTLDLPQADQTCGWVIDNKTYTVTLSRGETELDSITVDGEALKVSKQKSIQRIDHADTDTNADFRIVVWEKSEVTVDEAYVEAYAPRNSRGESGSVHGAAPAEEPPAGSGLNTESTQGLLDYLGSYSTGFTNADGGVAEIVKYNADNGCMYLVSGQTQTLDIVKIGADGSTEKVKSVDIGALGRENGFVAGDITSVDVNTGRGLVAIAVQHSDYDKNGAIVLLDYDGGFKTMYQSGVQPDMITFSPDGRWLLTADEGEPRNGYGEGSTDPLGSVTLVDLDAGEARTITFAALDASRDQLLADGVLLKSGAAPSADLEPEYIAVSADSATAYVTLQENNAVASLDLASGTWNYVLGLGFKDHSAWGCGLDIDVDGTVDIRPENVWGVYMPDGIAAVTIQGVEYLLTANEGDAREWGDYTNTTSAKLVLSDGGEAGKKIEFLDTGKTDGLDADKTYLLGGRSFSIRRADTLELVYDSGDSFETVTAEAFPEYFNSGHDEAGLDKRSNKKGPEPETVAVLEANGRTYAVIGLERMGGILLYDISDPASPLFADYLNVRDFSAGDLTKAGDLGPEGICTVPAEQSPTGSYLILVANEVSGTVTLAGLEKTAPAQPDLPFVPVEPAGPQEPEVPAPSPFADVNPDSYCYEAVLWAVEQGITSGTGGGCFSPDAPCTRAQIVTFLWRAAGSPAPQGRELPFTDVPAEAYYASAVLWAAEQGITSGTGGGRFSPDAPCTRAQIVTFLWRAQGAPVTGGTVVFADVPADVYYAQAVQWAVETGVTVGTGDSRFSPDGACTRAQAVTLLQRALAG